MFYVVKSLFKEPPKMLRLLFSLIPALFAMAFLPVCPASAASPVVIPGIAVITAEEKAPPPSWAVLERRLMQTIEDAAPQFLEKYSERGGRMPGIGKPDDIYEDYGNWPLFYALGGSDRILELALREWNAITRQLTESGRVKREFVVHYDWFHHSENYKNFFYFGLADPTIPENADRAVRFAAMYTGADSLAQNYDPVHRIMRSPVTGATGPLFEQDGEYLINHGHASLYPFIREELPLGWEKDPAKAKEIGELYNRVVMNGDTPISLNAVALVANAWLYTGDERYRSWIREYVDAWMERIKRNKGVIPDNVGRSGKIGENRRGQWWGGHFGWSARYSQHMIFGALTSAAESAFLVTGDPKYLDLLRSQLDVLFRNSHSEKGQLLFPYRYGPKGWFDYRPLEIRELSHLWNVSMEQKDRTRVEQVLAGSKTGPRPYDRYNDYAMPVTGHLAYRWISNGIPMDFTQTISHGDIGDLLQEQEELNEAPRYLYLAGRNPGFPERMLEADLREVYRRVAESDSIADIYKVPNLHSEYIAELNPVVVKSLVFLTMGGPMPIYNGGLLQTRVRHFDPERGRPGLPEDVAALVEKVEPDRSFLQLVNTSAFETRRVIVQAGAYGEHQFTTVSWREKKVGSAQAVGKKKGSERRIF